MSDKDRNTFRVVTVVGFVIAFVLTVVAAIVKGV